jgi:TRAP transporter TAXI family solute receptor
MTVRRLSRLFLSLLFIGTSTWAWAASGDWPKSLTLGTASPGGVYYIYGEALAQILTEKLGIAVNQFPTQGPVHNVKLIETGGVQLGMITMGVGLQGWNGTGDWTNGQKFRSMRALFPLYDTPFQFVVLQRSEISTVAQFNNKNIGVGPRAGTGGTYVPAILKALGMSAKINNGSFADMTIELQAGRSDALVAALGAPMPALKAGEAKEPLRFISLSAEETETVRKAMPELTPSTIPAGTYVSLTKDYHTVGLYNFTVGRDDLPEDLVYQLVKTVFENQARLVKAHSSALETIPQNVDKNTFLPFHPGALRYYREKGIKIPDQLAAGH